MTKKWDVVIVGGGLAGYVAANYLAKRNRSVLILEKGEKVGGRARTDKVRQQYFNVGPHALYKQGKARSILEQLNIEISGQSPKLDGVLVKDDTEYAAPFTPIGIFKTGYLNWRERMEWMTFVMKIKSIDTDQLAEQTFQQWVKQAAQSKKIQSLLYILGRLATYCHAPEKTSAKVIVSHLKTVMDGVLYLDGGWQMFIDQLHNQAVVGGVQVRTRATVQQIIPIEHDQLKLVLSNGEEILGQHVICTAGPNELIKMLGEHMTLIQDNFLANTTPIKGATLDVALSQLPNPKRLFAMSITDPLYFSVHSNYARLSEDGKSAVLHVFKYYHPDDHIDSEKIKIELEQFLERMQPGWQKHKITSRYIPQIIVNQRLPQIGDEQYLLHSKTDIPGLYIAGDWASPHSMLAEGAITSGFRAAEEITQK